MTDIHTRGLRAIAVRFVRDRLDAIDEDNREALRRLMLVGDTKAVELPAGFVGADQHLTVGKVSYGKGVSTARVTDPAALLHWVKQNRPTEVVEQVRGSYLSALLADAKREGTAVSPEGEVIPGIEVTKGAPRLAVIPDKSPEAETAMLAALFTDQAQVMRSLIEAGP